MKKLIYANLLVCLTLLSFSQANSGSQAPPSQPFTLAIIPDTQNYLDYSHQTEEGFALDSSELFIEQMRSIAARSASRGGDIVFVASVGDVWQHQSIAIDEDHRQRGLKVMPNPFLEEILSPTKKTRQVEIPKAIEGYQILADAGLPFGVSPGNHDYDAMWTAVPPEPGKDSWKAHIGGLDNFRSVFGSDSSFFRDKSWYVDSYEGGANSAQIFTAGGYRFLHIALDMQPADEVLAWAARVMESHPGLPTIISTHDYLNPQGERRAIPILDLTQTDPKHHNSAEDLWDKLISQHDQVFLVLCGHHYGQSRRVDNNRFGHKVYQILADFQERGQAGIDAGQPMGGGFYGDGHPVGIGDGWYRLMRFDLGAEPPRVKVQTWSSHYKTLSVDLETYAQWYRAYEQPNMSDAEFHAEDDFELTLDDFRARFGPPQGSP